MPTASRPTSFSRLVSAFIVVSAVLPALGCSADAARAATDAGPDDGRDDAPETGLFSRLEITPPNAVLTIDTSTTPPTAAVQAYAVKISKGDGTVEELSASAVFTIPPAFGAFAGNTFTSPAALPDGKPQTTTFSAQVVDASGVSRRGEAQLTLIALRKSGEQRDFFFVEPYQAAPQPTRDVLRFGTHIQQVDVAFAVDTTASMGGVISALKNNLQDDIIPKLKGAIPDVGVAVTGFDDFPVDPFGTDVDQPFYVLQTVTTDIARATGGVHALKLHDGGDGPESHFEAIYQILTGAGVTWSAGSVAKKTNAPGTYGYVDFRPGSLPVVIVATDIGFHEKADYASIVSGTSPASGPHGRDDVVAAYRKTFARHIGISTFAGGNVWNPLPQQADLARESGSYVAPAAFKGSCGGRCCTELGGAGRMPDGPAGTCLLSFKAEASGAGVADGIVNGISALAAGSKFDVTAAMSNDPANADGVDATKFVKALRAMSEGDAAQGCPAAAAIDTDADGIDDTFVAVTVGVPVCFEVIPTENTSVPAKAQPQFFDAFVDVLGVPGAVKLDRRKILFLVPPSDIAR